MEAPARYIEVDPFQKRPNADLTLLIEMAESSPA